MNAQGPKKAISLLKCNGYDTKILYAVLRCVELVRKIRI
jgi:hypothetical protein